MDAAEAILSTVGARQATWQASLAAKLAAKEDMGNSLADAASHIASIPTLLKKGREERELKELNQAVLGGWLEGGPDGAEKAGLAHGAVGLPAQSALFGHLATFAKARDTANLLSTRKAIEQRTAEHEKAQSEAAKVAYAPVWGGTTAPQDDAALSMLPGGGPAPETPTWSGRVPTPDESLSRISKVPGIQLSDLAPFMTDDRARDLAKQRDSTRLELDAAKVEAKDLDRKQQRDMEALRQANRIALLRQRAGLATERDTTQWNRRAGESDKNRTWRHGEATAQRTWAEGQNDKNRAIDERSLALRNEHEDLLHFMDEKDLELRASADQRANALATVAAARTEIAADRAEIETMRRQRKSADVSRLESDIDEYEKTLAGAEKKLKAMVTPKVDGMPERKGATGPDAPPWPGAKRNAAGNWE